MPTVSGQQNELDKQFNGLMAAIESMNSQMRSLIVPKQPLDPGVFLDEYTSSASSPLIMQLQVDRPALVTNIVYAFTPFGNATLTIGAASGTTRSIPIQTGAASGIQSVQTAMIVRPGDTITLTSPGATAMFVEIMGKVLTGTDWSRV